MLHDGLTPEQREIRDLVRTLARERIAPRAAEIDKSAEFPWDVVELFRENGIFATLADEAYGGVGASALQTLISVEEVSKVCATSGLILAVQELGALGLKLGGNDEQKQRFLPAIASGETLAAYALTEPGSGSDAAAMRSEARRDGDEYVLDGSKRFITNAGVAGLYVVFAKTDPAAGHRGISAFVVEGDAPGLEIGRIEPKMGIKGSTTGEVLFDGCRVPAANRLGEEGDGFRLAMRILDRSRPGIAAQALGIAAGRDRLRARVRADAGDDGRADRESPARRRDARRHGDAVRGGPRAPVPLRRGDRRGRRRARADEALGDDEALLLRHRDGGDDRRRAGARRLRVHAGVPGRADDARRQDHPDLRGHEPDPAARDRPRDAARAARLPCSA